jgi:carbamate kinase
MSQTALIAIGGNSLIRAGEKGTIDEQLANTRRTARAVVGLIQDGFSLVLTHGNGPQVGAALLRSERASDQVYGQSLDVCDATTQGEIGYLLQQSLYNELQAARLQVPVATVLTQAVVSADDPAMHHPTKPIGPFYSRGDAEERARLLGWQVVEDAARGYRRVVPSPEPVEVVEEQVIRTLLAHGVLVIAAGGGGIPVVRTPEGLRGVEAVIDKDRVSALLATRLGIDCFIISTDADRVYVDYRKPTQRPLARVTASELQAHYAAGQFPPGNMGPKIESALRFLKNGGKEVIVTSYEHLRAAAHGEAGTHIVRE